MKRITLLACVSVFALAPLVATAQSATATDVQRDVNQQQRIEQGLQNGQLTTREAGQLERGESHIDSMEKNALRDGSISKQEQARIQRAQNRVSQEIASQRHDAQTGDPNSASSRRMQADVQRDVNQQRRIEQGVKSGALTNRETGRLEGREGHIARDEANTGANGHVAAHEQRRIQTAENRDSRQIQRQKHNDHWRN
jgi:hypothetical protein